MIFDFCSSWFTTLIETPSQVNEPEVNISQNKVGPDYNKPLPEQNKTNQTKLKTVFDLIGYLENEEN